jgi:cell division protein FtsA
VAQALLHAKQDAGLEELDGLIFYALSGSFIETVYVTGSIEINHPGQLIELEDFEAATRATSTLDIPRGKYPLPSLVNRLYRLADGRVLFNPIGQCSRTLEVETQHFLADFARANTNFCLLANALGDKSPDAIIYTPLTLSAALFDEDEDISDDALNLIIDLGAGMTSISVPTSVGQFYCGQIAVGCDHIANDLSIAFGINISLARNILEQLGNLHCSAIATHDGQARLVRIPAGPGGVARHIPASSVETVIEARLQEIFEIVKSQLEDKQVLSWIGNRVILSGGSARIPRLADLAARTFNRSKIEIARPFGLTGRCADILQPQYTTVAGVIRAGLRDYLVAQETARQKGKFTDTVKKLWTVMTDW